MGESARCEGTSVVHIGAPLSRRATGQPASRDWGVRKDRSLLAVRGVAVESLAAESAVTADTATAEVTPTAYEFAT